MRSFRLNLLCSTGFAVLFAGMVLPVSAHAQKVEGGLPDARLLESSAMAVSGGAYSSATPLYPSRLIGAVPVPLPSAAVAPAPAPVALPSSSPSPVPAVPLYPSRLIAAESVPLPPVVEQPAPILVPETAPTPPAPVLLPSETPAKAEAVAVVAPSSDVMPVTNGLYVPPASFQPPSYPSASAVAPVAPVTEASAVSPSVAPAEEILSDDSRALLSHIPSALDTPKLSQESLTMERVEPKVKTALTAVEDPTKNEDYKATGVSLSVHRPGLDVTQELVHAYTALMSGDTDAAVARYEAIVEQDPKQEDALFGLAATYHRMGKLDQARPLYARLIGLNPNHREAISNFLVLISEESPNDALPELERLEQRNPDFSPIPAQTAILLDRLGYGDRAREKMLRAIDLAPNNLNYKYNLAIMLDKQGQYSEAAALYQWLIEASLRGETIPADRSNLEKRYRYLAQKNIPSEGGASSASGAAR